MKLLFISLVQFLGKFISFLFFFFFFFFFVTFCTEYHFYLNYVDRQACANSAGPNQMQQSSK